MKTDTVIEVLNDLVMINNDRIEGYKRAISEIGNQEPDLRKLFQEYIDNSIEYKNELAQKISDAHGEVENSTTNSGEIYRFWMDLKAAFSGNTRKAVLESCEFGEDAAQKAYSEALQRYSELSPDIAELIGIQQGELKDNHDRIRSLRDIEKSA